MIVAFILVIGLAFGSLINAVVYRIHGQTKKKSSLDLSIIKGRSMCPNCKHILGALDLIPVFSFLMLRGRCRYCHKPISIQYPLVELVTAALFIVSYLYWPFSFNSMGLFYFIVWLILLVNLIALAVYDIRWMLLPNRIVYPLFGLVLVQILATLIFYHGGQSYLEGLLLGLAFGGGIFYILFQVSKGQWIGGGDVKLGALLGLYLASGFDAIMMIFIGSVIGTIYSVPLLATGKVNRKSLLPFGPYLIVAAIVLRLFAGSIKSWLNARGLVV